jgi:hypothetical protein
MYPWGHAYPRLNTTALYHHVREMCRRQGGEYPYILFMFYLFTSYLNELHVVLSSQNSKLFVLFFWFS